MNFDALGLTIEVSGKIMLGVSIFLSHSRVMKERRIDRTVLMAMKKERALIVFGIILIIVGYLMQLPYHLP